MTYYSSNGIDQMLDLDLKESGVLPEIGFACDVGANDGEFYSNTLALEEKGWTVLCVEPNPLLVEEGSSRRKLWRQVAAGAEDGSAIFHARGGHPYASDSSIRDGIAGQEFTVTVLRLDRILEEAGFHRLDVLTVDVEGSEHDVMKGFTLERWKPKIVVLEDFFGPPPELPGYEKIDKKQFDVVFRRLPDVADQSS